MKKILLALFVCTISTFCLAQSADEITTPDGTITRNLFPDSLPVNYLTKGIADSGYILQWTDLGGTYAWQGAKLDVLGILNVIADTTGYAAAALPYFKLNGDGDRLEVADLPAGVGGKDSGFSDATSGATTGTPSTDFVTIPGLEMDLEAGKRYSFRLMWFWYGSGVTADPELRLTNAAGTTKRWSGAVSYTTGFFSSNLSPNNVIGFDRILTSGSISTAEGWIETTTAATIGFEFRSTNVAENVTIEPGMSVIWQEL